MKRLAALALLLFSAQAYASQTVYYIHTDALHSEVVVTDANHNVVERTYYSPYGQVLNRSLRNGPGYAGHEEDAGTGLDYMQQRYYDPQTGTFMSPDPVDVDPSSGANFNRYAYAADNPYRFTDPDGREQEDHKPLPTCTGSHVSCPSETRFIQVGTPSVSEMKAAAAAALALRAGSSVGSASGVVGGGTLAGTLLGGVAVGALIYPSATASDDTADQAAARDYARPIESWKNPSQGAYVYRIWGGGSAQFGQYWTPINPFLLRAAGFDVRDVAGLPNVNTGAQVTIGRLINPSAVRAIERASKLDGNNGGLIQYVISNSAANVQVMDTFKATPAF
jgi:RHS repeat-associated protein